jgi:hypothetical protein
MSEFLGAVVCATEEKHIRAACEEIKDAVIASYPHTPNSRRKPMAEIREAIRGRFPAQEGKSEQEKVPFPYYFTCSGKGSVPRWEHLAIKYLKEDWNPQQDWSDVESASDTVGESQEQEMATPTEPPIVNREPELDILAYAELNEQELEDVKQAIGDADVKEWAKQAMLQRANAINALQKRLNEDLSMVSSSELMNEKKYRTNTNATLELVKRAVRVIKDWNYNHPDQKWCITNKLISEVSKSVDRDGKGVTVKAIAKAVEGMDLESYNKAQDLTTVMNRTLKGSLGEPSALMSIKDVVGIDE